MKLSFTERYSKKEAKFFAKHQDLLDRYEKVLIQLKEDYTASHTVGSYSGVGYWE